jgi:hypothetical protein
MGNLEEGVPSWSLVILMDAVGIGYFGKRRVPSVRLVIVEKEGVPPWSLVSMNRRVPTWSLVIWKKERSHREVW